MFLNGSKPNLLPGSALNLVMIPGFILGGCWNLAGAKNLAGHPWLILLVLELLGPYSSKNWCPQGNLLH
eukprot:1192466-Prorocentrum_lima.AAC.1